jgi:hypothetical protein
MNEPTIDKTEESRRDRNRLSTRELLFGLLLTCTSGAAVLLHTFGPVPLVFAVPAIVLPTAAVVVGLILLRRRLFGRLHLFADLLFRGGVTGLAATFVYDVVRPPLTWIFRLSFNPYRAMPFFGELITGLTATAPMAITVGWLYHFWNGISFGMMFALFRPGGGIIAGLVWGLALQGMMMAAYPQFLKVRLDDPGFLVSGLVGHAFWGVVLGWLLQRWKRYAS